MTDKDRIIKYIFKENNEEKYSLKVSQVLYLTSLFVNLLNFTTALHLHRTKTNAAKMDRRRKNFSLPRRETYDRSEPNDFSNFTPARAVASGFHNNAQTFPAAMEVDTRERNSRDGNVRL